MVGREYDSSCARSRSLGVFTFVTVVLAADVDAIPDGV